MPLDPAISIHELARICAMDLKRRRKVVSGAIRQALTPTPMSARASVRPTKLCASAKPAQPSTAAPRNTTSTRRGPKRSSALPNGSCVDANPRK